ncbi:hypothetical protein ACOIWI_004280, partial [Vibrio vulnificus]
YFRKEYIVLEELRYLSRIYYQNTVSFSYFEARGILYLIVALILFLLSAYFQIALRIDLLSILLMIFAGLLLAKARRRYDRNLIRHLSNFTLLNSDNVDHHKAVYLQTLVSHIGSSLFDAMKDLKEIREIAKSEHGLSSRSEWSRFCNFIYNPDSKNRILSLVIYLISLVALIVVPRSDNDSGFYHLISHLSFSEAWGYLMFAAFFIVLGYVVLVLPVMYLYKFGVVPMLLKTSSVDALSRFFISELAKYAYLDNRVQRSS